ncbi:complex I intermediate-associated protein 30, mitochondrial-like [Branchiostoma floridae x Branchiostoma japonicum]
MMTIRALRSPQLALRVRVCGRCWRHDGPRHQRADPLGTDGARTEAKQEVDGAQTAARPKGFRTKAAEFFRPATNAMNEVRKYANETLTRMKRDDLEQLMFEDSRVLWKFRGPEDLDQWLVSSDKEMGGKSEAHLTLSENNTAFFHGVTNIEVPKDGATRYSGYAAMRSKQKQAAFNRRSQMDLSPFNVLNLRVRGDGRSYMITLSPEGYFSSQWNDLWCYFFFTRGGPHWQDIHIPFSKFFMTSKGRVQDAQCPVPKDRINTIGITLGDKINGPFELEIDFMGVTMDMTHKEEFAYEQYYQGPRRKRFTRKPLLSTKDW